MQLASQIHNLNLFYQQFWTFACWIVSFCSVFCHAPRSSQVQTDEDLPEGFVRLVRLAALTPTSLRVTWQPVDPELANGFILGYNVTYSRVRYCVSAMASI